MAISSLKFHDFLVLAIIKLQLELFLFVLVSQSFIFARVQSLYVLIGLRNDLILQLALEDLLVDLPEGLVFLCELLAISDEIIDPFSWRQELLGYIGQVICVCGVLSEPTLVDVVIRAKCDLLESVVRSSIACKIDIEGDVLIENYLGI